MNDNRCSVRLNQVGYIAGMPANMTVLRDGVLEIRNAADEKVLSLQVDDPPVDASSGDRAQLITLPPLAKGEYTAMFRGEKRGFTVSDAPCDDLLRLLMRGFYYQRCGCALEKRCAGAYTHGACHTAKAYLYADPDVRLDVSGGWHDAGDYGRYTGPGAVALGHLLYAWLLFPDAFAEKLNIPESGNPLPDILNECKWELDWLLKMQRADGGIYHKVTKKRFAPFIMPEMDTEPEYVLPVSHCATAAVSACLALAYRAFAPCDAAYAGSLLTAAQRAFAWIENNPDFVPYRNPEDVRTGWYGDDSMRDECFWAAAELYAATGSTAYRDKLYAYYDDQMHANAYGWRDVAGLGYLCCLTQFRDFDREPLYAALRSGQQNAAEKCLKTAKASGYGTALDEKGYCWGSILPILSNGICQMTEYLLSGRQDMLQGAADQISYMTGMNALDVCFVTGIGQNPYRHPHHRPSGADGIDEPVPGLVSGGPNGWHSYPSTREKLPDDLPPAKYWLDETPSADTNEIAIYWNSPAVLLTAFVKHIANTLREESDD